jgi:outer membrane protein assembly factor BamD
MKRAIQTLGLIVVLALPLFLTGCKTAQPLQEYQGLSDENIYDSAQANLKKGKYEQAAKDLEALDTLYPFGPYSQKGQMEIIDAYYKSDDADSALAAADRYIRLYPRSPDVDYAYYMKGMINAGPADSWYHKWARAETSERDLSDKKQALTDFSTLIEQFPKSQYVPEAKQQIARIRGLLAQHELEVAEYYWRHSAFVAAANRANNVIEDYPGSAQIPGALAVMVKSYRALNQNDMANNALGRLQSEYPDSAEAKQFGQAK